MAAGILNTSECSPTGRMRAAMELAASEGRWPVALYGAGRHAGRVHDALVDALVEVIGFIDDDPRRQGDMLLGFPILSAAQALSRGVRCIILSSDTREPALWARSAPSALWAARIAGSSVGSRAGLVHGPANEPGSHGK